MSKTTGNAAETTGNADGSDVLELDSGLAALQRSPEFRGPVEPMDGDQCNDHFALLYERPEEQFDAIVPFLRQGIRRGERCMVVIDELDRDETVAVLREAGVAVDRALASGQLSFHTVGETYLRNGTFEPDEMVEFYADAIDEATAEHTALRVAAETTWLQTTETAVEAFMEYEAKVNDLFDDEDCIAMCTYDRAAFPPDVVRDIVRTHPHLIYDGSVCHNVYHTPPEEFFGPEQPAREVDRMLGTLRERTEAKTALQERERYLRRQIEVTADPDRSFEEKLQTLFELGCERFELEFGGMALVDPATDRFAVEYASHDHDHLGEGAELPLSETYCTAAIENGGTVSVIDPVAAGYDDVHAYREFGIETYHGTYVEVEGGPDRTLFFVSAASRDEAFSGDERTFLQLIGQWAKYELERRQRERQLERSNAVMEALGDPVYSVDEDGQFTFVNEAFGDVFGYEQDEILGEHVSVLMEEPGVERARELIDELLADDERRSGIFERSAVTASGERRHCEDHMALLPTGADDAFRGTAGVVRDVTERKRRETELELFRNLIDRSNDGVFVVDPETGRFLDVNDTACRRLGYDRAELLERSVPDIERRIDDRAEWEAIVDEIKAGDGTTFEGINERKDGTTFPVEINGVYVELDDAYVLAIARDVTERVERNRFLRESYEITSDPDLGFEQKLDRLLELGRERFDLDAAGLTHLPSWDGKFLLEYTVGYGTESAGDGEEMWTDPGEGCFCRQVVAEDEPVGMADVRGTHWEDDEIHREHGLTSYIGTKVTSESTPYGTLWFGSTEPRETEFTEAERTFLELMGQWVSYELEQQEHERYQRELHDITASSELTFDGKIERLLELGRERFDLGVAMLTRETESAFRIETMLGDHPELEEGVLTPPMTDNYCRRVVDTGESIGVADAGAAGWDGDALYDEFDLQCYAGTQIEATDAGYGTICFTDTEPRETEFTEAERTFLELMGQWVSHELERQQREDRLAALNSLARDLMDAESTVEVSECIVDAAEETLDLPVTAIALYDEDEGELRPAARTDDAAALLDATGLLDVGEGAAWEAFIGNEACRVTEPLGAAESSFRPAVTAVTVFPLDRHGVLVVGSTSTAGFGSGEFDFVETVAANTRAAFDRAHREQLLQERERTLEQQNETLERLDRVNDIIRSIDQSLVQASTRSEIETVVCEQLADVGPYELAWIGEHDAVADAVRPVEWAGAERGFLDGITIRTDESPHGGGPTGRAVKTGHVQVVDDVLEDASFEPWRQDALNRGYHGCIALPLAYEDTLYGVLNVYAGQPGLFDDLEESVLTELADNIAYAINAVESKKALVSDEVTELEFRVDDGALGVVELVERTGCEFSHESLVPLTDGQLQTFFSTRDAPAEDVLAMEHRLPVTGLELVSEREADGRPVCLFQATLTDESLPATVLDHGGRITDIAATDGAATVTAHLAGDANIREFSAMFQSNYPDSTLVAQRSRELPRRSPSEFHATLTEELTARQREVLQLAFASGYFESPRTRTGSEIADALDIAQPTFNTHLRTAQRKLCRLLFEEESSPA